MINLPPDFKQQWLEALRTPGKYAQTVGNLRRPHATPEYGPAFCCLGVACDISGTEWDDASSFMAYPNPDEHKLPPGVEECLTSTWGPRPAIIDLDADSDVQAILSHLNDTYHYTFEQIADVIEANL